MRTRWIHQILLIIYLSAAMVKIGDTQTNSLTKVKQMKA